MQRGRKQCEYLGQMGFSRGNGKCRVPEIETGLARMRTSQEGPVARAEEATGRQKERCAFIIYGNNFHIDLVRDIKKPNIKIFSDSL